jgi:hypothetical protein
MLYHQSQDVAGITTNDWSGWNSLGGEARPNTDPVVIPNADGKLELFGGLRPQAILN